MRSGPGGVGAAEMPFDEALFEQQVAKERTRRRRDLILGAIAVMLLILLPLLGVASFAGSESRQLMRLVGMVIAGVLFIGGVLWLVTSTGEMVTKALMDPGGGPRGPTGTSLAESIAMTGNFEEASAQFEALRAEQGDTVATLRAEAEMYAGPAGNAERAKELFQRMRRAPDCTRPDELYATHRLVDLYFGPLGEPDRALTELRRIVERFPETRDAEGAAQAIERHRALREQQGG